MREEFKQHRLNADGTAKVQLIGEVFSDLLDQIDSLVPGGRELAIVKTKLEEAKMFAVLGVSRHKFCQE